MKTTIEIKDYEVKIEEMDGVLMISVAKDGEIIEEMEIGGEEDFDDEEMDEMDDEDMDEIDDEDMDEMDDEEEDEEGEDFSQTQGKKMGQGQTQAQKEAQLESFSSFIRKKR